MNEDIISGILQADSKPILFSSFQKSFKFSLMTDSVFSILGKDQPVKIPVNGSFICGITHDCHNIAIYSGDTPLEINGKLTLNTSAYIISSSNLIDTDIMEFEGIKFVGKTLNSVFHINGIELHEENENTIVKYNDDSITQNVNTSDYNIEFNIGSSTETSQGFEGTSIKNDKVSLTLKFDTPQPLIKVFNHYDRIKDLLSFMTYRNNVGFDNIYLLKTNSKTNSLTKSAEVFIQSDSDVEVKHHFRNICFENLGDSLPELLKLFYDKDDNKSIISLGFIPINNEDVHIMSNEKVRAICTAIECELRFATDIKPVESKELNELVRNAHETVKTFRDNHNSLTADTYSLIFSSIKYWSLPLGEKLCALYHKYETEIVSLNDSEIVITDELIRNLVKYRNDITHGKHRTLNREIAITAHYMGALVYCCVLERIGISRDNILKLCQDNRIIF